MHLEWFAERSNTIFSPSTKERVTIPGKQTYANMLRMRQTSYRIEYESSLIVLYLVLILWKLSQAPANTIFCVYRWYHLNFSEQLPLVEQYHAVNISSSWLDPERVIGQQLVSHDLFLILWNLLRRDKSTSSNELNSPNYSILFSMVFELFLCGLDGYIYNQC